MYALENPRLTLSVSADGSVFSMDASLNTAEDPAASSVLPYHTKADKLTTLYSLHPCLRFLQAEGRFSTAIVIIAIDMQDLLASPRNRSSPRVSARTTTHNDKARKRELTMPAAIVADPCR